MKAVVRKRKRLKGILIKLEKGKELTNSENSFLKKRTKKENI